MAARGRRFIQTVIRDRDHEFIRQVSPVKTTATLKWNAVPTAYLRLPGSHPIVPTLTTENGLRCEVLMVDDDGAGTVATTVLLEGRVGTVTGSNATRTVEVPVAGDFQDFSTMLGWQVPAAAITAQGTEEYARYSGTSEENAKAAIAANADRLGRPWDVAAVHGHPGADVPLDLRMHSLSERMLQALIDDRLQLTIARDPLTNRWDVDVVQGESFPRPLTPRSGVLKTWSWVREPPTATRAVVGGRGDGTAREFALVVDEDLEAELGIALEIFVDARNAEEGAPLAPYGWAELAKHRGKVGLTAELKESSWFRFPTAYTLGTRVLVQVDSLEVEDVITQIVINHDVASGFTVEPTVGLANEDPQARLVGIVGNAVTAVRGLEKR